MFRITLVNFISLSSIILKITVARAHSETTCQNGYCPTNKPFCTPVGCVFQCPENTFVNGSNCAVHCGDLYIYNNTCVPTCPSSHRLVEEKVKAIGLKFHKYEFCRNACPLQTYQFNGTCIKSCPDDKIFVEKSKCLDKCSNTSYAHRNITLNGRLVGIECVSVCNDEYPFQQGEYCVSVCDKGEVIDGRKCSLECPKKEDSHIGLQLCIAIGKCMKNWPEQIYCSESCPERYYSYNKTCVKSCPIDARYILNSTCVGVCPSTNPYYNSKYLWWLREHHLECTNRCPFKTEIFSSKCVSYCINGTKSFNDTCVRKCPQNTYTIKNDDTGELMCAAICPKYIDKGKCVDLCPKLSLNKTCVGKCPNKYKTIYRNSCELTCPNKTCLSEDGISCTDKCSLDPRNNTFANVCPKHTPYRRNNKTDNICVSQCELNEVLDNDTCIHVTECKRAVLSHGRCRDECPKGYLYMTHDVIVYRNEYSYTVRNLKNNPCIPRMVAYVPTIFFGLFSLSYGSWFCVFITTKQVTCSKRRNRQARKSQTAVIAKTADTQDLPDDTFENVDDVRLTDVMTDGI